jgi:hypothetical protein
MVLFAVACGSESGGDPVDAGGMSADAIPFDQRYLPIAEGATWTWKVTASTGATYEKVTLVGPLEDVGGTKAGTMAFKVTTTGDDGKTVSWQEVKPSSIQRHREQSFDLGNTLISDQVFVPYKLRLDERGDRISNGATFMETYTEVENGGASITKSETWVVEGVDVMVTTEAGTFSCLQVKRIGEDEGAAQKTYYFAKGVGKVKEVGKQTEELKSYTLP